MNASAVPIPILTPTPCPRLLRETHCYEWLLFTNLRRGFSDNKRNQFKKTKFQVFPTENSFSVFQQLSLVAVKLHCVVFSIVVKVKRQRNQLSEETHAFWSFARSQKFLIHSTKILAACFLGHLSQNLIPELLDVTIVISTSVVSTD